MNKSSEKSLSARIPTPSDGDGTGIHNHILMGLPSNEAKLIIPKLEFVRLKVQQVLHEPGDTLRSAYFPISGLVSILTVFPEGKLVEVGLVGKEGFIGLPLLVGFRTANTRAVLQVEGSAHRIDSEKLTEVLSRSPTLARRLHQFALFLHMEATQIAACNRLHEVNERLARWLLMSADRLNSNNIPLTQEALSHMLGTRRSSVTVAAGMLETAGMLSNARGRMEIIDRQKLEQASCECFTLIRTHRERWRSELT